MPDARRMTLAVRPKQKMEFGLADNSPKLQVDLTDERSVENLARVCRYLMDEGKKCLRAYFDAKHPPEELIEHLTAPETHRTLRRLKIKDMLTDEDWLILYPKEKASVTADKYDLRLLVLLVKYVCGVPKPLPNGWMDEPDLKDDSQGAAIQRLISIQREMTQLHSLKPNAANRLFGRIGEQLQRLEYTEAVERMTRYKQERLDVTDVRYTLDQFLAWYQQEVRQLERETESQERKKKRDKEIPILQKKLKTRDLDTSDIRKRQSVVGKAATDPDDKSRCSKWAHIKTGMVLEERRILDKYYDRLLMEVKADTVVEHLMNKEIINQDESTEIFATLRNNEQMSTLIDFLVPKSGNVLDEFVESLKAKNEQLYQQMYQDYQAAKADILANKPQGLPYCNTILKERYASTYSKWNPIPWYTKVETNIAEFYCQQQLLNLEGKCVNAFGVFEHKEGEKDPHVVVIEGDPGTGKSTLAKYMAYNWASNENIFGRQFQLLILLDLKVTAPTVKVMMMEQIFGSECKLAEREIWEVMDINQATTLLIVDGYEDNLNDEMKSLLFEHIMPELHILVFSQTNFTVRLSHRYQRKVILTGFAKSQAEDYVQKYIKLAKKPLDHFSSFLNKLAVKKTTDLQKMLEAVKKTQDPQPKRRSSTESAGSASSAMPKEERPIERENTDKMSTKPSRTSSKGPNADQQQQQQPQENGNDAASQSKIASLKHYSQVPLYCSFFCLLTDMRMNIDLNSPTTIVEQFVSCIKLKLIEREKESRFEANRAYAMLSERAMDTMKKGSATFMLASEDQMMTKFGLVQLATNLTVEDNERYMFGNRLIQEYLAAKYLDSNGTDEASRFFQNMSVTPSSYNVVVFYCSIRKSDNDTPSTRELFSKILQYNKRRGKASRMKMPSPTSPDDNQLVEGKIMDYQLSLECVAVMDMGRKDLGKKIVESLPERFTVKHEGIIPRLSLTGLSKMIKFNHTTIQEVDLRLDLLAKETLEAYKSLATAMKTNNHIMTLRIYWTEKDLMADFLKTVCCPEQEDTANPPEFRRKRSDLSGFHLKNLECIDESGKKLDQLSPRMLNNMREACSNMTQLETFAFQNCQHMTLVGSVIKNLPTKFADRLRSLDFSGCQMSIVASQDLNSKLVESKSLEGLILANLKIDAMAFNTFIAAFSSNRTIVRLDLSGIRLDNVCFFSLSEALKINNKLEKLYLKQVPMDDRACKEVARILKINKTMKLLSVSEEVISEEGRWILGEECQTDARKSRAAVDGISMKYTHRPTNERPNTKRAQQSAK